MKKFILVTILFGGLLLAQGTLALTVSPPVFELELIQTLVSGRI